MKAGQQLWSVVWRLWTFQLLHLVVSQTKFVCLSDLSVGNLFILLFTELNVLVSALQLFE